MNPLAQYIKAKGGSIYRRCSIIQKIAYETGYSVETVYRAAVGKGEIRSSAVRIALSKYRIKANRRNP